ncbi:hypothetical protein L7F22_059330 [Adiantum nelumboides]|nr:hypothetical protein [Adiantum nelumboides]
MADKGKDKLPVEESSSSTRRHRRETTAADTQSMASARTAARTARAPRPIMTAEEQEGNDLFTAQLMSMMSTFEQLAKNPRMQKLLKTKDYRTGSQAETSQQATSRQRQVTEPVERVPTVVTGPVQHVTQAQDPARNGHRSNEQSTHLTIPMHTSFPGYFGGGSVFQSMIIPSSGFQGYMPSTGNPMYDNIGVQPGFQIVPGSLGMAGTDLGMAGPSRPYVRPMDLSGRTGVSPNTDIPLLKPPVYDSLTPKGKAKDYGQAVKFEPFFGTTDRMKALIFLQQFDATFNGGNFTEASKIRKAASFLKGNALQWWATLFNQGQVPSTWVQFKQIFALAWLTSAFEVDVMTAGNQLSSVNCESLEEYNQMFRNAFLPVSSFKMVPLTEKVEKARNPIKVKGQVALCFGNSAGTTQVPKQSKSGRSREVFPLKMGPFGFDLDRFQRERKFEPIAAHVNALFHVHNPVAYPWLWTWKDASTKVQNMRHQYLGVKAKIRNLAGEVEAFDWEDGLSQWSNFLKYKEVFGDQELDVNDFFTTTPASRVSLQDPRQHAHSVHRAPLPGSTGMHSLSKDLINSNGMGMGVIMGPYYFLISSLLLTQMDMTSKYWHFWLVILRSLMREQQGERRSNG